MSFTFKFRESPESQWKWANEQLRVSDGQLLYQTEITFHESLSEYFDHISSELNIILERSDVPDTALWSLKAPVKASDKEEQGRAEFMLGHPKNLNRWFSLVRLWSPWLAPRQGRETYGPDKDAILSAFLLNDGRHLVILAISGYNDVLTTFGHDGNGGVVINSTNDGTDSEDLRVVAAIGHSFETAKAATMYYARRAVMKYDNTVQQKEYETKVTTKDEKKSGWWMEHWYDGLSYCTWNGLGQNLTEDKILKALESLEENGITSKISIVWFLPELK